MEGSRLPCDLCDKTSKNKKALQSHKNTYHRDAKSFPQIESKNLLTKPSNKTEDKPRIVCPFCGQVFDKLEQLRSHFQECFYDEEDCVLPPEWEQELKDDRNPADKYLCWVCTESARTLEDLTFHKYESHPTCLKCGMSWKKTREYKLHAHSCKEEFDPNNLQKRNESECPICRKVEYNLYQLKRHLENDHGIRRRE